MKFSPEAFSNILSESGITQKQLSKKAGVSETTISHCKIGDTPPSPETLDKIGNALGVTFDCDETKKDRGLPTRKRGAREIKLLDALTGWVVRVTSNNDDAPMEELALVTDVSKALLEYYTAQ